MIHIASQRVQVQALNNKCVGTEGERTRKPEKS